MLDSKIMLDPKKYGYKICPHCNGYGSSLKEQSNVCTMCGGYGLVKENVEQGIIHPDSLKEELWEK